MTDELPAVRSGHPYIMYDMIKETPAGIRKTLEVMGREDYSFPGEVLYFTGNGTAYHSAVVGAQSLWESGKKWHAIQAYEIEKYYKTSGTVIGFSHTGKTKSTVDTIIKAKLDSYTVGVTHYADSPLAMVSDHRIIIGDSPDKSLCNTKAFFDNVFASLEIAKNFGDLSTDSFELLGLVERTIRDSEKPVKEIAENLNPVRDIFVLGSGPNYIAAREAAQKIKESTHLHAEGIELEEFNHGCTSVIDDQALLVILDTPEVSQRTQDIVKACRHVATKTLVLNGEGDFTMDFPVPENRYLYPITAMVPLYYLAYFLALRLGVNPDYLRFEDQRYLDYDSVVFPPGSH